MPEKATEKQGVSHVVKVTGMSEALLGLLDTRVRQQQATGRSEYIRELIRRDVIIAPTVLGRRDTRRHKARRRSAGTAANVTSEQQRLVEYHELVDLELDGRLSPDEQTRLRGIEEAMNQAEAKSPETQAMFDRLEETAGKLDALLAAVRALPQAEI